jgi:hypothetical protein
MLLPLDSSLESFAFWQVPEPQKAQSQSPQKAQIRMFYTICAFCG